MQEEAFGQGQQIESALRKGEMHFRCLLEKLPAGAYTCDAEGLITYFNHHAVQLWGRAPKLNDPADRYCGSFKLFSPDGSPIAHDQCWMALALKMDKEYNRREIVIERPNGQRLTALAHANPIHDESSGELLGAVNVLVDITERKRAEEERERLFALAPDPICVASFDGYLKRVNPAFEVVLGYSAEELLARPFVEFVHPEDRTATLGELKSLADGKPTRRFENRYVKKDGSIVWLSWKAVPVVEEGLIYAAARDVTEQRRAEEELRTRARQQRAVADLGRRALRRDPRALMDEAVSTAAETLEVEYCNVLELLPDENVLLLRAGVGWQEGFVGHATVSASRYSQAGYTLLSDAPMVVEDIRTEERFSAALLLREHGVVSGMSTIIRGRERPFGVLGAHTKELRSFTEYDVSFLRAIANVLAAAIERARAEERLHDVKEAERGRIARDLHDVVLQDLAQALQELETAHRLLPPEERPDASIKGTIEALRRSVRNLREVVHDLHPPNVRGRRFVDAVEETLEETRRLAPYLTTKLEVGEGFPEELPDAAGREVMRILQEALTNARRHSGARNVRVILEGDKAKICAEVADDGKGFVPGSARGGLGQTSMRERSHALGGDFTISSTPSEGTKVRFELALKQDWEEPDEEVRILLVEDHTSIRQATASVFEREPGFKVMGQAGSLSEARKMLDGVDVAVVDLGLPDGYGGELIKELRNSNPQAQALVLSAIVDWAEIARAVECGAAGVLHKMVEMEEVVEAVRRLRAGETLLPLEEVVELLRFAGSRREEEYEARQAIAQLTSREREVLQALAQGLDSKEIAERLHISAKTETNHMTSILNKLGLHSRLQALVFALRHGVVEIH
jgi:PAS domain S-box-containing protein